jgi:hypothetical protein
MVKAPKEGMLMEKIKLTQPAAQPTHKKANYPVVQPAAAADYMHKPSTLQAHAHPKVTKSLCESHMHRYVEVQAVDGHCYDGIVEHVDDEWICLAVPGSVDQMRGFFPSPYFQPFSPFTPFSPYRPRRFPRLVRPLGSWVSMSAQP